MSVGLYSGVSGLALGIGLYRNVSGLWGGASGLINGFGGADPYAGASLYLNFLNPELDSRITFSRGTNATLIDSTGRLTYAPNNILAWSQTFEDASWAKLGAGTGSVPVVTPNVAVAPDGTQTADLIFFNRGAGTSGSDISYISANPTSFVGNGISSIWLKTSDNSTKVMQLRCGFPVATQITVTGTWQRFAVNSVNTTIDRLQLLLYGTDPNQTASLHVWGAQLEQVTYQTTPSTYVATTASAYYGPRFDYDPVTLAPRGLLIEEARTNLLTYSDQFNNAAWSTSGATITANATASPDGTTNADALVEDASTGLHITQQFFTFLNATAYTVSVYVKASTRTWVQVALPAAAFTASQGGFFNLSGAGSLGTVTGTPTSRSITAVGNGWYRITITATSTAAAGGNIAIVAASADGTTSYTGTNGAIALFAYGAQLEAGSFATSYIPTVASTVTRNADVATMTGTNFSTWYNQSEGTFILEMSQVAVGEAFRFFEATEGTFTTRKPLMFMNASNQYVMQFRDNGVDQATPVVGIMTANTVMKLSASYKVNDFGGTINGGTPATDNSGVVTTAVDRLFIGSGGSAPADQISCHIRTIAYFNTRLPNAQLQTLTAPSLATTLSLDFTSGSYNVGF